MATTAAARATAIDALRASGVVVRVEPAAFLNVLTRTEQPLVVVAEGGVFKRHVRYLTSYRGLAFFTQASDPLVLPRGAEVIVAKALSVPDI